MDKLIAIPFAVLLVTVGCGGQPAQYQERQASCYHPEAPSAAETAMAMKVDDPASPSARGMLFQYQSERELRERMCP
jgi:hypothetical protein